MRIIKMLAVMSCLSIPVVGLALSGQPYGKTNVGAKSIPIEFAGKNAQNKIVTKPVGTPPATMQNTQRVKPTDRVNVKTNQIGVDFAGKPKPAP
ncbi:MAG: hypothetical protein P1U63_07185 [Coxiellaceae bacterium]|nr:hypothetical protein [Coxiellaceae bacterium]